MESPVQVWFGLSYASYLVLPRLVMQSMPAEWQEKMVALLNEADERFGHLYSESEYEVSLQVNGGQLPDMMANYRHVDLSGMAR